MIPFRRFVPGIAVIALVAAGCSHKEETAAPESATMRQGREVVQLCKAGDVQSIAARFTPDLAKTIPENQLAALLQGIRRQGAIGDRLSESVGARTYSGTYAWGRKKLLIQVSLDGAGHIQAFFMRPTSAPKPPPGLG